MFDSRTAVRQGDNIRLLTYITLLFLPLSFGTVWKYSSALFAGLTSKFRVLGHLWYADYRADAECGQSVCYYFAGHNHCHILSYF